MGFFKKIFKPVSKVFDKIIPNEIKPILPYAAAFAPYLLGPGAAGGSMFQRALYNPYTRAGIMGGINVGSQLAQEGNEGDINAMSAGLAALQGFGTAGGAQSTLEGFRSPMGDNAAARSGIMKFRDRALDYGITGANKLQGAGDLLGKGGVEPGLNLDTLSAASLPTAQATGDVMFAEAKRAQDAYEDELAAYEAEMGDEATDAGRALAIRQAMAAYGFDEDEIEGAISAAGYRAGGRVGYKLGDFVKGSGIFQPVSASMNAGDRPMMSGSGMGGMLSNMINNNPQLFSNLNRSNNDIDFIDENQNGIDDRQEKATGGRVGLRFGGIGAAVENIEDTEMKESAKFAMQDMDVPIMELVQEFEIKFKRKPNSLEELKQYYKDKYKGTGDVSMQEEIKEKVVMEAKDGGLMNLGGKEMDMRGGGFIPIGKKERADDVPARLSKNEFVMTADAVRAAGGGSVNEGAKRMYETMNKLEARA